MTIPLRLGILNNKDAAIVDYRIPACGFGEGGKWGPLIPGQPVIPHVSTPYVGYWKLDETEGSEAIDISENILPMEYIGDPSLGVINAPYFDGLAVYARGENIAMYDSTTEISIVAFYKVDDPPNAHGTIVSKYITTESGTSWGVFLMYDGKLQLAINGGQNVQSVNSFYDPGITYKIVFTYDGTTAKLYVNDIEESLTGSMSGYVDKNTTHINIGRTEGNTSYFKGWIKDVIIYRYVLTLSEVIAIPIIEIGSDRPGLIPGAKAYRDAISAIAYNKVHFGLDDGRVGYSDIGVSSTITWNNLSTYKADAIAGQAPLLTADNNSWGSVNSNTFVDSFQTSSNTLNMWCYMTVWPTNYIGDNKPTKKDMKATLLVRSLVGNDPGYLLTIFAPGVWGSTPKLKFAITTDAGQVDVYALVPPLNGWFMISGVVDDTAGTVNIFINGVLSTIDTKTYTPGTLLATGDYTGNIRLGVRDPNNTTKPQFFDGYMEEVTLIAGAMTAPDLLNLYTLGNHYD
jgi:hypothetical protein